MTPALEGRTRGKVVMLVGKEITHDARVHREAASLAAHGYEVAIACRSANDEPSTVEDCEGYRILAGPIPSEAERARDVRRALRAVRSERLELSSEVDGEARSRRVQSRLAELEHAEAKLSERREILAQKGPPDLEKRFRRAWAEMLRESTPEVIHVHDHPGLATALKVRGSATAVVYDAHEHLLGKDLNPGRRPFLESYLRRCAPLADAVVTVGSAIAEQLERELKLPATPIVVHNTPSLRDAKSAPYDLRAAIGIDSATSLLVYTGSLTRRRRLDTVIRALVGLPDVHLAAVLLEEPSGPAALADELGVAGRVHFPPPVPHDTLVSLVRDADIGIHPLDRYGNGDVALPNKLFEYLHADLPMVVSHSPQMAAFVREHGLGEIAPADDPDAWRRGIVRVLANRDAYRGEPAARERLRRQWSWEAQEDVLLSLYKRLTEGKTRPDRPER